MTNGYMPGRDKDRRHWHFDKRLSMDTVIAAFVMLFGLGLPILYWGRAMEQRVLQLETINIEQSKLETQRDSMDRDRQSSISMRLDRLEQRMTDVQIAVGRLAPQDPAKAPR